MIINEAISYLEYNFGDKVIKFEWAEYKKLPMYLSKGYDFCEIQVYGQRFLLMDCTMQNEISVENVKTHIKKLRESTNYGDEIIIVGDDVSTYYKERLINEKISFIIPGKIIYVPILGMIYNEKQMSKYSRVSRKKRNKFTPTTQALLLELLTNDEVKQSNNDLANKLAVSQMSISRAYNDLVEMKILSKKSDCYIGDFCFTSSRKEIWERVYEEFLDPVMKRIYVNEGLLNNELKNRLVVSGESALSKYSMLNSPNYNVYGITNKEFKKYGVDVPIQPFLDTNSCEIEIWRHKMPIKDGLVSLLSILVLMRDEYDERVQDQLEQIIENYEWRD